MSTLGLCLVVQFCLAFGVAGLLWPERLMPFFEVLMFPGRQAIAAFEPTASPPRTVTLTLRPAVHRPALSLVLPFPSLSSSRRNQRIKAGCGRLLDKRFAGTSIAHHIESGRVLQIYFLAQFLIGIHQGGEFAIGIDYERQIDFVLRCEFSA